MARVLVTRAEPGASETAARLTASGHEAILAPMLSISPLDADNDVAGFQGLLFTSANGVAAFAAVNATRTITAFCVGDATGDAARSLAFADVRVADGDVRALEAFVAQALHPQSGALLHVAGADLAGDLQGALALRGFTVERRVFYRAVAATVLPPNVETALKSGFPRLDAALFHSARGAAAFAAVVKHGADVSRITALCLSDAVAQPASALNWREIVVAHAPREAALLALLAAVPEEN